MIEEQAVVVSSNSQYAWVAPVNQAKCSGCPSSGTCSSSFLTTILSRKSQRTVRVDNLDNAVVGDRVIVGIHAVSLLWSSVLAYLLPVLSLIGFAILGQLFWGELVSVLLGFVGLALGLFSVTKAINHTAICGKLEPVMLGKSDEKVIEFTPASKLIRL